MAPFLRCAHCFLAASDAASELPPGSQLRARVSSHGGARASRALRAPKPSILNPQPLVPEHATPSHPSSPQTLNAKPSTTEKSVHSHA
eukprot:610168-Rhodomonas_salina.4